VEYPNNRYANRRPPLGGEAHRLPLALSKRLVELLSAGVPAGMKALVASFQQTTACPRPVEAIVSAREKVLA
jgi:hypothetical protein